MSNKTYTIKEAAEKLGTSKQSIYAKLNKYNSFYEPHISVIDKEKRLDEECITLLKNNAHRANKSLTGQIYNNKRERELEKLLEEERTRVRELTDLLIQEKDKTQQALLLAVNNNQETEQKENKQEERNKPKQKQTEAQEEDKTTQQPQKQGKLSRIWKIIKE